ncbi:MAG TPA: pirin family protein, partial [Polyangiaceae bacterium]|nr:pirin family protein [Polyangiaceae bacterium]
YPFLLIDEMGPIVYPPGQALGAPDHPHRGFETVTYVLEGGVEHEDSAGHRGTLGPGDVQWMTAGGGIIHSETPTSALLDQGGRMHGFQIWINLPARLKMTTPRYQEVQAAKVPRARSEDGRAEVNVIAGSALGIRAVIETHTPIVFQDWKLESGADVTVEVKDEQRALVYVFEGTAQVGDAGAEVGEGRMGILGEGGAVRLRAAPGRRARLLLLAGVPLAEPVARYGPFVMNTEQELLQAFQDFRSGKMGEITRTAQIR